MPSPEPLRLLTLPGWQGSGPDHWQSHWETVHRCGRVEQADWLWPRRGDWMARLDEVVQVDPRPAVLIAHSLGCQLVGSWAAHSAHADCVQAALLVAPPDTERDDMPPNIFNWRPITRGPLPFASLMVVSSDDPYCAVARAQAMAADWRASMVCVGDAGHLNGASGLGEWPQGWALLQTLLAHRGESRGW